MTMLRGLVAGLCACALPAHAQAPEARLSPPVNVVAALPAPGEEDSGTAGQRQSMVIEEDGTVRFLTPAEAAELFIPADADSRFIVDLDSRPEGPDSLRIEISGAEITATVSPDGSTRIFRIEPDDGSPARLVTITKD